MPNIFNDEFSILEHEGWGRVSGQYDSTWSNLTRDFIPSLLDAVGIEPGKAVLDVACGPGYAANEIQLRGGHPVGVDFSAEMIAIARKMFPGIRFVEGDAQQLEFPDGTFDSVVMNFGMLHLVNPRLAINEAHRVLKPDGRFGFTVWAGPEKSPVARVMDESMKEFADLSVRLPVAPDRYLFGDEQLCRKLLIESGFSSITFSARMVEWAVPTADYYFETEMQAGVRTVAFLKQQTQATLDKIRASVSEKMDQFYRDGLYRLQFCGCVIAAVRKG